MFERGGVGTRKALGQMLVEGAFAKPEEVEKALEIARRSNKKLGEVLIEQKLIAPETLATVLSFQHNVPIIDLKQFTIQPAAIALVTEEIARQHNILPLAVDGDTLTIAMEDPGDLEVIDTLTTLTRKRIKVVIPLHGGIRAAIDSQYKLTSKIEEQVKQAVRTAEVRAPAAPTIAPEAISQAPVVRAVDLILTQAVKDRASDIHIEPQEDGVKVRYRVDGVLHDVVSLPTGVHAALISRIKVQANMNIAEKRRPQDGQFSLTLGNKPIDFRVATVESSHGEMAVLRVLDKSTSVLQITDMGLSLPMLEVHKRVLASPYGMVIVSGPTGSGKTTTLYASLGELNARENNIMTIEDPMEYHFKEINQIQVNREAGITFAAGLRAIMRLDPDIILVGEIRDQETANVAVQAALTGHLVLTSIHANDSISALLRLINLGVEPFLASSAIMASLSQRLVRKVCPYCRMIGPVSPTDAMVYQQEMQETRTDFYYGRGCNFCSQTGYLGRVGVFELLTLSDPLRQLVAKQAPAHEIKTQALKEGLVTLRRDGMLKARDGITTPREVIRSVFTIG